MPRARTRYRFWMTLLVAAALTGLTVPDLTAAEPMVTLIGKAQPDEFYQGLGKGYIPLGEEPPDAEGQPKVNDAYIWGMTSSGDSIWLGTAANPVLLARSGILGLPVPTETSLNAAEYWLSNYPGIPAGLRAFIGDWRPPHVYRYRTAVGLEDVTPDDPLIQETLGIRSAGATSEIVLLGGPDITQLAINLFAFDAVTGDYLGSKKLRQFSNIRRWINVNGDLYTSTLDTWTLSGSGSVLRWRGSRQSPFDFEIVGKLDNDGAALALHEGRLFAFTWSAISPLWETLFGARAENYSGVWMSPPLGPTGLSKTDRRRWTKVWSIDQYDPDPVVARSVWMGACASFDGHLCWGTIQVPTSGAFALLDEYGWPEDRQLVLSSLRNSFRTAALFRGRLDVRGNFQVELLYGDRTLPTFVPGKVDGVWVNQANRTGPPRLGGAGFDHPDNLYVWSMAEHQSRLYVGTFDLSFLRNGERYVSGQPVPDTLGGDLMVFDSLKRPAVAVSRSGLGNIANNGFRDLLSFGGSLFCGTATSANLLTDPDDNLVEGGWELLQLTTAPMIAADPPDISVGEIGAPRQRRERAAP